MFTAEYILAVMPGNTVEARDFELSGESKNSSKWQEFEITDNKWLEGKSRVYGVGNADINISHSWYMNFIFECSTRYLTSERRERVRCQVEHEHVKFIFTRGHVIFCLLHKLTNDDVLTIFRRFQTTFPRFPKIFQNHVFRRKDERFQRFCGRFPKVTEDFWGGADDVSIIQQHI